MNIDDLTYGQMKEIIALVNNTPTNSSHPYRIGKMYFIRTVTMALCGKLISVGEQELILEDAAWIADTGRFMDALNDSSKINEIEPFPAGNVIVGRGAIVDAVIVQWNSQRSQR